jgi:glycosyltransferase involved in cell wall biosynthesis
MPLARSDNSLLLGNSVDLSDFDPARVPSGRRAELRRELGIAEKAPVILVVGRLVQEKGWRELFDAAASIRARRPEVRFVGVGGAEPTKSSALVPAEVERARENVILTGWRDDVRDLMAAADVFALPSWREGVPGCAIEAAAMGLPLVLTDIRGCREVGRHDTDALLVPPRDPMALAAALETLLDDAALRSRLGAAAHIRARERFDDARVHLEIASSYRALLNGAP